MSDFKIEVSNGFLSLRDARTLELIWVKGSTITCVKKTPQVASSVPLDAVSKLQGSILTIGDSGWAVSVMDEPGEILLAIADSYKQARAR